MAIRDTELLAVPMDNAAGTCTMGKNLLSIGMSINPAPPPHIALMPNARKLHMKIKR